MGIKQTRFKPTAANQYVVIHYIYYTLYMVLMQMPVAISLNDEWYSSLQWVFIVSMNFTNTIIYYLYLAVLTNLLPIVTILIAVTVSYNLLLFVTNADISGCYSLLPTVTLLLKVE